MGFLANTALVWGNLQNEAHKKDTRGERMNQNASFFIPIWSNSTMEKTKSNLPSLERPLVLWGFSKFS